MLHSETLQTQQIKIVIAKQMCLRGYTGVSSYLETVCGLTCAGKALAIAKGASAVRLARFSKSESGGGGV